MVSFKLDMDRFKIFKDRDLTIYLAGRIVYNGIVISDPQIFLKILNESFHNIDIDSLSSLLRISSGNFAVIIRNSNSVFLASDIIRSIPLFINKSEIDIFISEKLDYNQNLILLDERLNTFVSSGIIFENQTIFENITALQAAEIIEIEDDTISSSRYFRYIPNRVNFSLKDKIRLSEEFDVCLMNSFRRMIEMYSDVNNWIIPLSGGHDSRLIANYLYRLDVKNVICFSYGKPNNSQSEVSKLISERFGFEWHFIEYSEVKWKQLYDKKIIDEYLIYSFNGVSTPHLQDFLAVYELCNQGIISSEDIILPGHSPITQIGYNERTNKIENKSDAIKYVINQYSVLNQKYQNTNLLKLISKIYDESNCQANDFIALINWQERQSKFIINSIRAYEFFRIRSHLPFWDINIVKFWLNLNDELRSNRDFLIYSESKHLNSKKISDIRYVGIKSNSSEGSLKEILKKILPEFIIIQILRITQYKSTFDEGLNEIYALSAKNVGELLNPIIDFPLRTQKLLRKLFNRYPYQMDYHILTSLITIRKVLDILKLTQKGKKE